MRIIVTLSALVAVALVAGCQTSEEPTATFPPTERGGPPPTVSLETPTPEPTATPSVEAVTVAGMDPVMPFTNIARKALGDNAFVNNWHPGSAFFDFDRDGDMDFYVTQANEDSPFPESPGGPNLLFRNDGENVFTEVGVELGADVGAMRTAQRLRLAISTTMVIRTCTLRDMG